MGRSVPPSGATLETFPVVICTVPNLTFAASCIVTVLLVDITQNLKDIQEWLAISNGRVSPARVAPGPGWDSPVTGHLFFETVPHGGRRFFQKL